MRGGAGHSLIILLIFFFFLFLFLCLGLRCGLGTFAAGVNVVDRIGWRWIQFCCVKSVFAYYYYYLQCRRADRKAAYMETRHRAVLSRFVLLIVCIRFGFGLVWFSILFFELHGSRRFRVRVSSSDSSSSCEFWVGTTDTTVHGVRYRMQVG